MREPFLKDIRLCSVQDVVRLFLQKKKRILQAAFGGAFFVFALFCLKDPSYLLEASFKEQTEMQNSESRDLVKQLFSGSVGSSSMQAKSLMTSRSLLRPVIEKLGLQAELKPDSFWLAGLRRVADLIRAEGGRPLAEVEAFRFSDLHYEGEKVLQLAFFFTDPTCFDVFEGKKKIASGVLGQKLFLPELQFTLKEAPRNLKINKRYQISIAPWQKTFLSLRKKIHIAPQKTNGSHYDLSFVSRDRLQGALFLNELMAEFQRYLHEDHSAFAEEQLAYLSKRQKELFSQFEEDVKAETAEMSRRLADQGCLNLSQELQVFLASHAKMREKELALELEGERLEKNGPLPEDSPLFSRLSGKYSELRALEEERDLLEISLSSPASLVINNKEAQLEELKNLREEKRKAELALDQLRKEIVDPEQMLASWAGEYLSRSLHLLSIREKALSEQSFQTRSISSELEGLDWESSRALCKDYQHLIDESEKFSASMKQVLEQIDADGIELGCFSACLKDPASQHLIASADTLSRRLKEDKYCSAKESARWKEDLTLQRQLLKEHLEHRRGFEEAQLSLLKEKLGSLQQTSLSCLHKKISIVQEAIQTEIAKRRSELIQEKKLLEQQMKTLRSQLSSLPEKWQDEKLFELKSKAHQSKMAAIVQLVETKTISHHLHQVGSKPIDLASLPLLPTFPFLTLSLALGAFFSGGFCFFAYFLQAAAKGFPLSGEKLQRLGLPFSGLVSPTCDGPLAHSLFSSDVETLRKLCLFAEQAPAARILGLFGGKGPDFSFSLAARMAKLSKKVCLLRCDFLSSFQESDLPGLLQMTESWDAEIPWRKMQGFDYLPSGGYSEFGAEWIQSSSFHAFLERLKSQYDLILLYFRSSLNDSEAAAVLKISDKIVLFLQEETIDLLTPFISWAYDEKCCRLTFVAST